MKYLLLFISLSAFGSDFKFTPLEDNLDLSNVPTGVSVYKIRSSQNERSPSERDAFLDKYLKNKISNFDEVDRDILYKSILLYDVNDLLYKYPFLSVSLIQKMRHDFN